MNIEIINIAIPVELAPQIKQLLAPYVKQASQQGRAMTPDFELQHWQLRTSIEVLETIGK